MGEATILCGPPGEAWVLLCLAIWILPKVQLYITVSDLRFCVRWRLRQLARPGPAEACAEVTDQVQ